MDGTWLLPHFNRFFSEPLNQTIELPFLLLVPLFTSGCIDYGINVAGIVVHALACIYNFFGLTFRVGATRTGCGDYFYSTVLMLQLSCTCNPCHQCTSDTHHSESKNVHP